MLKERGVELRSLHESIDTTTPADELTFHVFAALAELERDVGRERTRAGLAAARARESSSVGAVRFDRSRSRWCGP